MIHRFSYHCATTIDDAGHQLGTAGATPLGGGTDLLVCIQESLSRPETVVDLTRIPEGRTIEWRADGGVRIGGAVRLAALIDIGFFELIEKLPGIGRERLDVAPLSFGINRVKSE